MNGASAIGYVSSRSGGRLRELGAAGGRAVSGVAATGVAATWPAATELAATGLASTWGAADAAPVSFEQAMLRGLAPDGGLYLPQSLPSLPPSWRAAGSPSQLAALVLPRLLGLEAAEVEAVFARALNFPLPLTELPGERFLLELFHGPTAAFKDVGARAMAQLMDLALQRLGRRATILVATSGDTGSAVADAFAGLAQVRVALLYPAGRVSRVQELQLAAKRDGVTAFAVAGSFDDCQRLVKGAFGDPRLADLGLSSANSINVARLVPQMLYYLWGVKQLEERVGRGRPLTVVVPSGNLGNLTAGLMARGTGLPELAFVAAHNANDYLPAFLSSRRAAFDFAQSVATYSNAMDVGAPSNFERLYATFGDALAEVVTAYAVDDDATLERIRLSHQEAGVFVCPHTAVGLEALSRHRRERALAGPAMVLATADSAKFPEIVKQALGFEPPPNARLSRFETAEQRVVGLEPKQEELREALLSA